MRIGMVLTSTFPPDPRVEKEALSLTENGHEVFVLCLKFKKEQSDETYLGINIIRKYMPRIVHKKLFALVITVPFYRWFWRKQIKEFIDNHKIDVLHVHDLPLCGEGIRIAKQKGLPLVGDMHENYPELIQVQRFSNTFTGKLLISKKKWYRKEKQWLNKIDNIVCVEKEMMERMSAFAPNARFYPVPNTPNIDNIFSQQTDNPEIRNKTFGKFNLFYFGKTDNARGIDTMIESIKYIKDKIPEIHMIVVGSGIALDDYIKQTKEMGYDKYISFEGWHPESQLRDYMAHVDVSIIPHIKSVQTDNSSPNKLFIAMAFEKPVIVSNCNSIARIVNDSQSGLVYESGNAKALASCVVEMYQHPDTRKRFSENAKMAIQKTYDWNITVRPLIRLYSELADTLM